MARTAALVLAPLMVVSACHVAAPPPKGPHSTTFTIEVSKACRAAPDVVWLDPGQSKREGKPVLMIDGTVHWQRPELLRCVQRLAEPKGYLVVPDACPGACAEGMVE